MNTHFTTERLSLVPLEITEAEFIYQLVNTDAWLKFIGDRQVKSIKDAEAYIQKILDNPAIHYWTVKLKDQETSIGNITLIKRDYLPHYDIGFAFLPEFGKKGYAYEAAVTVLQSILKEPAFSTVLATAAPKNLNSTQLLEKLGLTFDKEIEIDGKTLVLYHISAEDVTAVR